MIYLSLISLRGSERGKGKKDVGSEYFVGDYGKGAESLLHY
jgi:hypothetical protein